MERLAPQSVRVGPLSNVRVLFVEIPATRRGGRAAGASSSGNLAKRETQRGPALCPECGEPGVRWDGGSALRPTYEEKPRLHRLRGSRRLDARTDASPRPLPDRCRASLEECHPSASARAATVGGSTNAPCERTPLEPQSADGPSELRWGSKERELEAGGLN